MWKLLVLVWLPCLQVATAEWENGRVPVEDRTPLDEYCAREDPTYAYTELVEDRYEDENSTLYFINMTSHTWLDDDWSTQSVWWHYMVICIPKTIRFNDMASMFISGGRNDRDLVPTPDNDLVTIAMQGLCEHTQAVTGYLKHIPNQPIYFMDDPEFARRSEDKMIAYTWRQFIDNHTITPDILARLPMTKAAVRAMDTITDFSNKTADLNIDKFVLAGGSKRGWVVWTAAAVDKRVVGQLPMVLTALDFVGNLHKHWRSLGGWSFALKDYYNENLTKELDNPRTQELMNIVDPYAYIARYTMPTMVVAATGDQFFLPDDSWHFYQDIPAEDKFFYISADSDHTLVPWVDVYENVVSFFIGLNTGWKFPKVNWTREFTETGGTVTLSSDTTPTLVQSWYAFTDNNATGREVIRDWRANRGADAEFAPIEWIVEGVEDVGENVWRKSFDNPEEGWVCFLIETVFEGPDPGENLTLTSEVQIVPNTYPYPDCVGDGCYGSIV